MIKIDTMHNVLDIDLDFFLENICPLAEKGNRPELLGHEPWAEQRVRDFLETNCGLSKTEPLPGRIFETHDGALLYWQELMEKGKLQPPFAVTHIDAHSDLAIGYPGPGFVLNTVISTKLDLRCDTDRYYRMHELDEANYLLFAIGMRYVAELINVRNPHSVEDIPREIIFTDDNGKRCGIQLSSFASKLLESINGKEPYVPYTEFKDYTKYMAKSKFDFVSLAMSPRYAPKEADALAEIIREYITE